MIQMNEAETIKKFIVNKILFKKNLEIVKDDDPLIGSGMVDSMGLVNLANFLEEQFAIKISRKEMVKENFQTIEAIVGMISRIKSQVAE